MQREHPPTPSEVSSDKETVVQDEITNKGAHLTTPIPPGISNELANAYQNFASRDEAWCNSFEKNSSLLIFSHYASATVPVFGYSDVDLGFICGSIAAVQNFAGLLIVRVLLGITEAPFFPGAIFLMSCHYNRAELTARIAWFYSGVPLANMIGGLIGAGAIPYFRNHHRVCAAICVFVLPDYPSTTRWLTEEEKAFSQWRLQKDASEDDDRDSTSLWHGMKLAFQDYRIWLFMLLQHLSTLAMTFQYFFPSIVATLGYGQTQSLLLTVRHHHFSQTTPDLHTNQHRHLWLAAFLVSVLTTFSGPLRRSQHPHRRPPIGIRNWQRNHDHTLNTGARIFAMFLVRFPMPFLPPTKEALH
ncbi:hypothetical protein Dsin_032799 [Dipteronia sinensis]|uniref:Uncharacterized protein n=1 Tax=Dipteronia sinensis TaxID=43782 RepID=A0AAD9ZFL9_9ROSI|nr:hypothetical protein Dsin_032799 [Dipteronia sinensis]